MARNSIKKAKLPPTLIIGLGGTGCEIVSRVDKLSNEEQRKFIRFVYFDTDANELRVRKEEAPYIHTVQTSRRLTVGQALRNDSEACENSFPINMQLLSKPLTEGAGQVRSISKLAFDACLREGRIKGLHDAINELQKLNGDSMEQSMRVVIVSTLVGGTGSGILLSVSLYLRHYLETTCQKKPMIRGFCVLPDVFFHGTNKSESEKSNLRANAYATLRELDAFMLKADSTQAGELSRKFWLKMPRPGTVNDYDDYTVSPMDFCFLFDGQNIDGDCLQNFTAYKQHAADCIYASSVSLLNKRLNSSEDNTILQRCAENGRNRYCGIGTSKMVYPFKDVRDYIAMGWMNQSMSDDWLRYDKIYEKKMAQIQASKSRGVLLPPVDRRELYCQTINSEQSENNFFSLQVYEECYNKDKLGISFTNPRWESYYAKLNAFISNKVEEDKTYDEGAATAIETMFSALDNFSREATNDNVDSFVNQYPDLARSLRAYFSKTKRHAEDIAGIVADSIFSPYNFDTSSEHHVEHWLTQGGTPIHPNSARFFLYSLEILLKEELRKLQSPIDPEAAALNSGDADPSENMSFADLEKAVKNFFEEKNFSVENGNDSDSVTIEDRVRRLHVKGMFGGKGEKKDDIVEAMEDVVSKSREHFANIKRYYAAYLKLAIIKSGLEYIDKLSSNYEYFFQQLDIELKRLPRRIERIEENYVNDSGSPVMYICASSTCLKGLAERCPNTVNSIQLTPEFRKALFDGLFKTIETDDKEQQRAIVGDLVSNQILDFWRDSVIDQYGKKVDIDIIDALRTQAEIEEGIFGVQDQTYYIRDKYDAAMKLSAPFIDKPAREPYYIDACAISTEVFESDDMTNHGILRSVFPGAENDPLMDKYQILCMKAIYNLRVSDLPKFAPADDNPVDPHKDGDYYKAYWEERIDRILPDSTKTQILTPHLDKRWHYIGVMPDLSEASEKRCVSQAHMAFLVSIVYKFVRFEKDQYRFIDKNGDNINDTIIVSDGRCNKLHEILEAMMMSRPLVLGMLDRYNEIADKELYEAGVGNQDYTHTQLYKLVSNVHLHAFDSIPKVSILELPILCKASMGNSTYNDDDSVTMVQNIMNFVESYLKKFYCDSYVRDGYFVSWIKEQADLMLDNIANYYDKGSESIMANPFGDTLVCRVLNVLISRIKKYESCDNAEEVADAIAAKWDELTK